MSSQLTVAEAAGLLEVSTAEVHRLIATGPGDLENVPRRRAVA